jgi:hypothetical protein
MTLTEVSRLSFKMPGRGSVKFGFYDAALTAYDEGVGLLFDAAAFGLSSLLFVSFQPADGEGDFLFDWEPSTGYMKAYVVDTGAEAADNALDAVTARVMYVGF